MPYDVKGLLAALPADQLDARKPLRDTHPPLQVYLKHGSLTELVDALIGNQIPEPWWTAAVLVVPINHIMLRGVQWVIFPPGAEDEDGG